MKELSAKISRIPPNLKATIVFAIASFATSGINYITTPIFTRILTTTEYGLVSVYNSWFSIIQVFTSVTLIYPGILNVGLYDHSDNRWKYLSSMLGITSVSTIFLSLIYLLFKNILNMLLGLPSSLMILMLSMCFFQPATIFWTFKQRYEINYKATFFVSVGSALAAQVVSVATVLFFKRFGSNLAIVRLWSAGAVNMIVACVLFIHICIRGKGLTDTSLWKPTFRVALPLIPHYLSMVIFSNTDKIMIRSMVGFDKTGIYSLAAILSSIGVLVWRALGVTFAPFVNAKLGERNFKAIREAVKPLLFVVAIFCIVTALAGPEIILILATAEYLEGVYIIPPVAAGIFIHALYDNFTAIAFFHKKSLRIMIATLISAIVNVVLNYFCIQRFGYIAAGYTTLVSNLVLTGAHYYNARIIESETVYDSEFSLVSTIIVIIGCLVCNFLYSYIVVRYILIFMLLAILVAKRKAVINAIVSMQ